MQKAWNNEQVDARSICNVKGSLAESRRVMKALRGSPRDELGTEGNSQGHRNGGYPEMKDE